MAKCHRFTKICLKNNYLELVENHFQKIAESGTDVYGPFHTPMWMSVIHTKTGRPPEKPHTPQRVYRLIGAPNGSTLYWDQPMVVAAHELSRTTGKPEYARAADAYINAFLKRCVDEQGIFQWGNHQYYDVYEDKVIRFNNGYHELRPITPAWELFWKQDRQKCERYLRTMIPRHIYDKNTGGFNRHDDGKRDDAFIEAGGILAESAAWLYSKTNDPVFLDIALKVAEYSYFHRGESTGLVINQPDNKRWDSEVCTTEIGVWANSLLKVSAYTSNAEFAKMARSAISSYLKYGYDSSAKAYYGQLRVSDGTPVRPNEKGYWPGFYSNIWNTDQWPHHDYPIALAEACISLYEMSREEVFIQGIHQWYDVIEKSTPANDGKGAYAESYGRCIHFLVRGGRTLKNEKFISHARTLAAEAIQMLYDQAGKMFQGYPGSNLYESVDGVGYLFLALIYLESGGELNLHGFGF